MKRRISSSVVGRIAGAGLVGAVVCVTTLLGAGAASAAGATIAYDCNIPIFGHKTLNIAVSADIPATGTVGTPVHTTNFHAVAPIPHDVYDVFTPFGATQADGTADVSADVDLGGVTSLPISATIPLTPVPTPSGPDMLLNASGPVPDYTPASAGTAHVSAGANFTAHVTPRDSGGNPTILGTLDVPCVATGATFLQDVVVS
jgi:hypothetical protein